MLWEATVTPPHGRTELERLADIDARGERLRAGRVRGGLPGASRHARARHRAGLVVARASSYRGLALDDDALYMATADGEVVALKARTGAEIWRQKALLHRGLSARRGHGRCDRGRRLPGLRALARQGDRGARRARQRRQGARISTAPLAVGQHGAGAATTAARSALSGNTARRIAQQGGRCGAAAGSPGGSPCGNPLRRQRLPASARADRTRDGATCRDASGRQASGRQVAAAHGRDLKAAPCCPSSRSSADPTSANRRCSTC